MSASGRIRVIPDVWFLVVYINSVNLFSRSLYSFRKILGFIYGCFGHVCFAVVYSHLGHSIVGFLIRPYSRVGKVFL